jgi:toxin ParE1/3/4
MRIRWTPPAATDLQNISDYLREHRPHYRRPTMLKLYQKICGLRDAPYVGRPGRVEGTRELLFLPLPYIAVHRLRNTPSRFGAFITPHKTGLFRDRSTVPDLGRL